LAWACSEGLTQILDRTNVLTTFFQKEIDGQPIKKSRTEKDETGGVSSTLKHHIKFESCSSLESLLGSNWWLAHNDEQVTFIMGQSIEIRFYDDVVMEMQSTLIRGDEGEVIPQSIQHHHIPRLVMNVCSSSSS
jgi:hypothetical protein